MRMVFLVAALSAGLAFGDDVAVLENGLRTSILEKVNEVNPVDPLTGARKYISFGFISDIHKCKRVAGDDAATNPVTTYWYGSAGCLTESEQSIRLLGSVASPAGLDAVINGGDLSTAPILGDAHGLTEAEYTNEIWNVKAMFDRHLPSGLPLFTVDGNHERSYSLNGANMHMSDAAWAYVLTNFNTSAAAAQAKGVAVTYHRDLAKAKLGDNVTGRYSGNSFHLDFKRLYATKGYNVRILCLNSYDSASGNDYPCRVYDAAQFFDATTGAPLYGEMTPSNTIMGMVAHGSEEKPAGKSEMVRYAAGDLQNGFMNGYSNAKSKTGPWNKAHCGRGFFGLVSAHFHFTNGKDITNTMDSQVNPDNKVYASAVSVASAYAVNNPSKPKAHELGTEQAYHFSIFVVDTDKNLLREVRIGGWTANPSAHEDPVVQLHDYNIRTHSGATSAEPEPETPDEPDTPDDPVTPTDPEDPPTNVGGSLSHYTWAVIGDSLSDPTLPDTATGGLKYYHYLARDTGIQVVYTNGVGSTGYKAGSDKDKCFYQRLTATPLPSDVDVVTIHGSVNDGGSADTDANAGVATDRLPDSTTLAAYINKTIDVVQEQAPQAKIILIGGPFYSNGHPERHIRAIETVRAVAAARGLAFHDWLTEDPSDPLDFHQITINTADDGCFASQYAYDWETRGKINESFGHPNAAYHEIWMAPHFGEALTAALKPTVGAVSVTPAVTNATLSGVVATLGVADATACDVYLAIGPDGESLGASTKIATGLSLSGAFSYEIQDLKAGTTYRYALSVSNNAAFVAGTVTTGSFVTKKDTKPVGALGDFAKKVVFTVGYDGAATLGGLAVPVKLAANSPSGFRYSDCETDGGDIRFADAVGNVLPFEIDTWNPAGESVIWVKAPAVTNGTVFTMYYSGTPAAENTPSATWSDYTGVWHLNGLAADVTPHSKGLYANSTAASGIDGHLSANSIGGEDGFFGKSFRVNDSTDWNAGNYNEGGVWVNDAGANSPLDAGGVFTISGWFKHNAWHYNYDSLFYKRVKSDNSDSGAFAVQLARNNYENIVQAYGSSSSRVRDTENPGPNLMGSWVYVTVVYNGKSCSIYENGALNSSGTIAAATDNDLPLVFGNNANVASGLTGGSAWNGWIDEVRFSKSAKSADWVAAEYAAMTSDSFVSASASLDVGEEPTPPPPTDPDDPTDPEDPDEPEEPEDPTEPEEPDDPVVPEGALLPSGDATGATDASAIQAAIDLAASTQGTVVLGRGLFQIKTELMVTGGVNLVGQGWTNTVVKQVTPLAGNTTHRVVTLKGGATLEGIAVTGGNGDANNTVGAGLYVESPATVSWCCITNNVNNRYRGGGLYVSGSGKVKIDHSIIADNVAGSNYDLGGGGGGMMARLEKTGVLEIESCLIVDNVSGHSGATAHAGGISLVKNAGSVQIRNTTVAHNAVAGNGVGGGLYVGGGTATLVNCLFVDNTSEATATYGNANIASGSAALAPTATSCLNLIGPTAPVFVGSGDYHLAADSAAIGAGTAYEGIGKDLDNRPFATPPSVGCYEYVSAEPELPTYLTGKSQEVIDRYDAWMKTYGADASSAHEESFLLGCGTTSEALEAAKKEFKIVGISYNEATEKWECEVTGDVGEGERYGNGYVHFVSVKEELDAGDGSDFFKATLEYAPVVNADQ